MRTPETLTAIERAEQLRARAAAAGLAFPPMSSKKSPEEQARASLMNGLNLDGASASAELDPRLDVNGSLSILNIEDIEFYIKNPRKSRNPRFDEIKESIKALGITNPITVTRRPGEQKYFPYGGGNTRLAIAKELYAEGDNRFARLHVVIHAWEQESGVIAAHLAENINRGETTFWDNAQGVVDFKREWEGENKEALAGAELHEQLRLDGVNYGIRMVQNFVFAAEYLEPIGPWLRTKDVNEVIRPQLGIFIELSAKLDKQRAITEHLNKVLKSHALDLEALAKRNQESDPSERVSVELDAQRLVQEASHAIAKGLDMPVAQMQVLADALQARPRMSAKELLALDTSAPKPPPNTIKTAVPPVAPGRLTVTQPKQPPLGPMMGVIGGTAVQPPQTGPAATFPDPDPDSSSTDAATATVAAQRAEIARIIESLHAIVPLDDCVWTAPEMPFGYFIELPKEPVCFEDETLNDLRASLWFFLAITSGQTQPSICASIMNSELMTKSRWGAALLSGPALMRAAVDPLFNTTLALIAGNKHQDGSITCDVMLTGKALWLLMTHPQVGPLLMRLIGMMQRIQANSGEIYLPGHLQLPEWNETKP